MTIPARAADRGAGSRPVVAFVRAVAVQLAWVAVGLVALALLAAASPARAGRGAGAPLRVVLFVNGTLGDKSFFDAAARGLQQARDTLGVRTRVVEGGTDPTRWQAALTDLADSGDWDLIVTGTNTMTPYVRTLAHDFPAARFVVYDAAVDPASCGCANVHAIVFRQNEGAYLAGVLAAGLVDAGLPDAPAHGGLGVVGGMQFPVVEDFVVGFVAGARAVDPALPVATQYANSFSDPAAGKEIAHAQFERGADIVFHVAGATGQGVNEAALESRRYAIGVDLDQAALVRASRPALAARIVTSVVKQVDVAVLRAIAQARAGTLRYGATESLGVAEGGVRLAEGSDVVAQAPPAVRRAVDEARAAIVAGRVRVPSAFDPVPGAAR